MSEDEILDLDDTPTSSGIHLTDDQRLPLLETARLELHERLRKLESQLADANTQVETLQDEVCKLRGALLMVEWVWRYEVGDYWCPWCARSESSGGHNFGCPRQAALNSKE